MTDNINTIVVIHQASGSLDILIVAFVSPPLDHISKLIVQSTGGIVIMREFVTDCTTCDSII